MRSDLVDIEVIVHHETKGDNGAFLVSLDGERKNAKWVPKSVVEIERRGKFHVITLPERMALDKGLI